MASLSIACAASALPALFMCVRATSVCPCLCPAAILHAIELQMGAPMLLLLLDGTAALLLGGMC